MNELKSVYEDVTERVECEEKLQKKRTRSVENWIRSVEAMEREVEQILEEGNEEVQNKCSGTCCPMDPCGSYKLGKALLERFGPWLHYEAKSIIFKMWLSLCLTFL